VDYPDFLGPSFVAQSPLADGERTMNFYAEPASVPGQSGPMALYPTPGVTSLVTADDAPGRAMAVAAGRTFCVMGRTLYEISDAYVLTSRNPSTPMVNDGNPATISWNGDGGGQLLITSGNYAYLFTLASNAFAKVRDPASEGGSTMGVQLDGYFVVLDTSTSTIYLSDLLDGSTWSATQFAQRSIASDPWVSMAVLNRQLWLLGSRTSEVWYNSAATPFPFQPHPSGLVAYGCVAPYSTMVTGETLLWLAATHDGTGQVVQTTDFSPDVVSSFAVSTAIGQYSTISDAIGGSYTQLGHSFYILTFPAEKRTWAFDTTPNMALTAPQRWAERGTWVSEENEYQAWRPCYSTYQNDELLVLDFTTGSVYRLDHTVGTDVDAREIRRIRRPSSLFVQNQVLRVSAFEVFLEPGLGLSTGQGDDPQVSLRVSGDGGKTFGNERLAGAGKIGEYGARTRWLRCGSGRRWMPEIVVSDPIPWRLLGASVSMTEDSTRAMRGGQ
tara:strand:+ start:625 stop:2118 length:1494 start_codon:yes stop_codon:yes gene_type:complete